MIIAMVNEVYLRTDRAASNAVGIRSPASTGVPVADQCHRDYFKDPTHREGFLPVDKPFVAALQLIISRTHGARKCMAVFKSSVEPICVFAVGMLPFLCDCRCGEKERNDNRSGQGQCAFYEPVSSVSMSERQPAAGHPRAAADQFEFSLNILVRRRFELRGHVSKPLIPDLKATGIPKRSHTGCASKGWK